MLVLKRTKFIPYSHLFIQRSYQINTEKQEKKQQLHKSYLRYAQTLQKQKIIKDNNYVNNTIDSFNPLTAYFWLYRWKMIKLSLCVVALFTAYKLYNITGVSQVKGDKKWYILNRQYEQTLGSAIEQIIKMQLSIQQVNNNQQQHFELQKQLRKRVNYKVKIQIFRSLQRIILILPNHKILLSSSIVQNNKSSILELIQIMIQLFQNRYHLKNIAFEEIFSFIDGFHQNFMSKASCNIKLSTTYHRQYSQQQVLQTIEQMNRKYGIDILEYQTILKSAKNNAKFDKTVYSIKNRLPEL